MIHSVSLSRSRSPSFLPPLAFLSFSLSISSARKRGGTVKYRRDGVTDQEGPHQPTNQPLFAPFFLLANVQMYKIQKTPKRKEKNRTEAKRKKKGRDFHFITSLFSLFSLEMCAWLSKSVSLSHTHTHALARALSSSS